MNFIEQIFGVSPDGGSGLLEWMILLAIAALIGFAVGRLSRRPVAESRSNSAPSSSRNPEPEHMGLEGLAQQVEHSAKTSSKPTARPS